MLLPLGLSYNQHPEKAVSVENAVNMQPEMSMGGRSQIYLRSCPGLSELYAVGDAPCRGMVETASLIYIVMGRKLYSLSRFGDIEELGRIDGTGRVGIATSGDEVFIAAGVSNYVYDIAADTLAEETTSPKGRTVVFINGRFVVEDPSASGPTAGRFYWSDVYDATTWNALNYATAEQKPDKVLRVDAIGKTLVVFGEDTVEFWRGDAEGFVPISGSSQQLGIAGRYTAAQIDNTVVFLASDGTVRQLNGYTPQRVSTPAVDAALEGDFQVEVSAYSEEGHTVFEFTRGDLTLCYDSALNIGKPAWFEKQTKNTRHKASYYVRFFGSTYAGAWDDGNIYRLTRDVYPDAREFTIPTIHNDENRQWGVINKIELLGRSGSGDIPADDPQIMLRISRDNGYTWGEERWRGMGTVGQYDHRIKWRRLGRFLQMALKFRITDQVDFTVTGVNADGG